MTHASADENTIAASPKVRRAVKLLTPEELRARV